jgi:hypothetical protein
MKKTIASILLGIALSVPAAYACDDLIVIGEFHCVLTSSSVINGHEICHYRCYSPKPQPELPPVRD